MIYNSLYRSLKLHRLKLKTYLVYNVFDFILKWNNIFGSIFSFKKKIMSMEFRYFSNVGPTSLALLFLIISISRPDEIQLKIYVVITKLNKRSE